MLIANLHNLNFSKLRFKKIKYVHCKKKLEIQKSRKQSHHPKLTTIYILIDFFLIFPFITERKYMIVKYHILHIK